MRARGTRVLAAGAVLTSVKLALAQQPAPQPQAQPPDAKVTVSPPTAPGEVPPPTGPVDPVEPPVPVTPQPPPPPSEPVAAAEPPAAEPAVAPPEKSKDGVAGWYPGFKIKSADDKFSLRIGLQAMYRFEPNWLDGEPQSRAAFFVVRPILAGHLFVDWIRFWNSFELAGNPPFLLDSYIEITPKKEIGLRIGQQYTPFSRHEYYGPQEILFPEWAPVAEYFWSGRDKGITLYGTLGGSVLDYWLGVYSGTPLRQTRVIDGNYVLEARATVNPMGPVASNEALYITEEEEVPFRASFTLQGYHANVESAEENFNPSSFRFDVTASGERRKKTVGAADIWLQGGPFAFLVEGYIGSTEPESTGESYTSTGGWGQVGVAVVPRTVDLSGRVNVLDASDDLDDDMLLSLEAQVGYYPFHTQNLVLKMRYAYADQQDPGVEGAPLYFAPGLHHYATVQLGLAL